MTGLRCLFSNDVAASMWNSTVDEAVCAEEEHSATCWAFGGSHSAHEVVDGFNLTTLEITQPTTTMQQDPFPSCVNNNAVP